MKNKLTKKEFKHRALLVLLQQGKLYMSCKGAKKIKIISLREFVEDYNKRAEGTDEKLKISFTEEEANKHLNEVNKLIYDHSGSPVTLGLVREVI